MRWAGVIGLLIIVLPVLGVMTKPPERERTPEEKEASRRSGMVYAAKAIITQGMRDPSSATFGNVFYADKAGETVCGYVNGKNGFGGYTGMKEFVVIVEPGTKQGAITINDGSAKFSAAWNKRCAGVKF